MCKIFKTLLKPLYVFLIIRIPNFFNKFYLKFFHVSFGKNVAIRGKIFIRNNGTLLLGNNVKINSNISSNPAGGPYKSALVVGKNATLQIGNNVGISGTTIVAQSSVIIEDNVMLGSGVCVFDTDFHSIDYENRIKKPDTTTQTKPVKICMGAFVGARSIILKGVTIGEKSVVGAGSVVTKSIPPGEIWAGNPAKFIKKI